MEIQYSSKERAEYALKLIQASHSLFGRALLSDLEFNVFITEKIHDKSFYKNLPDFDPANGKSEYFDDFGAVKDPHIGPHISRLPYLCFIASKISFRKNYQYAIFKLEQSLKCLEPNLNYFDPRNWEPFKSISKFPIDHVKYGAAIFFAYSVLEELGLEIRASKNNPTILKNGTKNPVVINELIGRLQKNNIDINQGLIWLSRNKKTIIQSQKKPIKIYQKAEWAWGQIMDGEVDIVDAIIYASYLRSQVSTHKFRELSSKLSFYDVINIQQLAFRLMDDVIGTWDAQIYSNR